ncbi:hypothetical protein GCM10008957_56310 [Deinococcus ruber]|uniref:Uncharacterized protein n=1 Tax=Deinococcus ruber TaxID=1848197 RepID=A0A918KXR8_9DEIO|nr:hypothetical protein GCM10008957_56310 [Deinococcus ruber]
MAEAWEVKGDHVALGGEVSQHGRLGTPTAAQSMDEQQGFALTATIIVKLHAAR